MFTNDQELNTSITLSSGLNGGIFGPYTIVSGVVLTLSGGTTFVVL